MGFPILTTTRLNLIEIKEEHLPDIYNLFSNKQVNQYYNVVPLKEIDEARKYVDWFYSRLKEGLGIRWGITLKDTSTIIGTLGFNNYTANHRANLGYELLPEYWNNGYMVEALKAIIQYGFEILQINRIEAEVMQGNTASEKLLSKLGFTREGVLQQ